MTVKPNGTDAKDIALHFISLTSGRATPHIIAKTITQAKSLLKSGYTKGEVIKVINHLVLVKKVEIYSLGYVNASINSIIDEIKARETLDHVAKVKQELTTESIKQQSEVATDGESTERNRAKSERFGIQSRFGKKFDFDMFEGHGQDN